MAIPRSLKPFIDGPLADNRGGNAASREAALSCCTIDKSSDEESVSPPKRSQHSFMVASTEPLFSYQQEIVDKLEAWMGRGNEDNRALVSLPTGGGKTRTALWFFRRNVEHGRLRRLLWVAPSTELVQQAVDTLRALWRDFSGAPPVEVTVNSLAPSKGTGPMARAVFVTAQLAAKRLDELRRFAADLLVFDEAHQAVARTFHEIIRCQLSCNSGFIVGLSATPGRATVDEGDDLQDIFANHLVTADKLGRQPVAALREQGVLSALKMHLIDLPDQWEQIRIKSIEGKSLSLDELAIHPARFWATVDAIKGIPARSKVLVFGASLAHCYALTGALRAADISAETISHNTQPQRRASILARFAAGEFDVLLNKTLLATGYDCPAITDVVLASPIRSPILWEQILGRASRGPAVGGTAIGRVWELDDHRKLHGRVLSYARFLGDLWS